MIKKRGVIIITIICIAISLSIIAPFNLKAEEQLVNTSSINIIKTQFRTKNIPDIVSLYNDSEFTNYAGTTNNGISSAVVDESASKYYFCSTFNPSSISTQDVLVTFDLILFNCWCIGQNVGPGYLTYAAFRLLLAGEQVTTSGAGFINADLLLDGAYSTYAEILSRGYTRGTTTSFLYYTGIGSTRTMYLTEFYKMGNPVDSVSRSNNLNNSYDTVTEFNRYDFNNKFNFNWSYYNLSITDVFGSIYDKSDNLTITSVSRNNGQETYYIRVFNDNKSAYITFCDNISTNSISSYLPSNLNIIANFYYDDSEIINNNYNNILNAINSNLVNIKNLLSDLQVQEINNIYNEIITNYNVDIDLEINNLVDDFNNHNQDIQNFINNSNNNDLLVELQGLSNISKSIFSVFTNNLNYILILFFVLCIIGAVIL